MTGSIFSDPAVHDYSVAVIPGDGIGPEVTAKAIACVDAVSEIEGFQISWEQFDWGTGHYLAHGSMMPSDGLGQLRGFDAILLGAVGDPAIDDATTLWGLLIPIRRQFRQYINLRPIRSYPGVRGPLADDNRLDMVIVRENSEGEYSAIGGRGDLGTRDTEFSVQQSFFSRSAISKAAEYAFELARARRGDVTSATKSNGIIHTMPFWDEVVDEIAKRNPTVSCRRMLIDALAARVVLRPQEFDVIVASNLFGDILSDLCAALTGSIGMASSGNINPEREYPSMFEAVHGSAPDIAGQGIANPVGQIGAAAMMLDHLGEDRASSRLRLSVDEVLLKGCRTRDIGGGSSSDEFAQAVVATVTANRS